jgi:hypothetical protein
VRTQSSRIELLILEIECPTVLGVLKEDVYRRKERESVATLGSHLPNEFPRWHASSGQVHGIDIHREPDIFGQLERLQNLGQRLA